MIGKVHLRQRSQQLLRFLTTMDTNKPLLRVASVLPSATEILCAIGGEKLLVGRSHEDNYPQSIVHLPPLTDQLISREWTSAKEVDSEVSAALSSGRSLYFLDTELLSSLKPDLILTQDLCSVCAIDLAEVRKVASSMQPEPRVLSMNPQSLEEVIACCTTLGDAVGLPKEAWKTRFALEKRVERAKTIATELLASGSAPRVKVAFIEWSDPIYVGGHWTPQLISFAGGYHTLNPSNDGVPGSYVQVGGAGKSFPVTPEAVVASDPDVIIVCPCGLPLDQSVREAEKLLQKEWFQGLRAVRERRLLVVDGDAMFNRPGPRLVDALEWLVSVLHTPGGPESSSSSSSQTTTDAAVTAAPAAAVTAAPAAAVALRPTGFPFIDYYATIQPAETTPQPAQPPQPPQPPLPPPQQPVDCGQDPALVAIEEAHLAACLSGQSTYKDPATGYAVFTEASHRKRGKCCGNKCRHCPFGHYSVKDDQRSETIRVTKPTMLRAVARKRLMVGLGSDHPTVPDPATSTTTTVAPSATSNGSGTSSDSSVEPPSNVVHVLFWSGGKDSYLAMRFLEHALLLQANALQSDSDGARAQHSPRVVLLTHFDCATAKLDHQGLSVSDIMAQAKALGIDLFLVPQGAGKGNTSYADTVLDALTILRKEVESENKPGMREVRLRLVFGDLHLQDIRDWRQSTFGGHYECCFPLFGLDYAVLQKVLWESAEVRGVQISAWTGPPTVQARASVEVAKGTEAGVEAGIKTGTGEVGTGAGAGVVFDVPLGTKYTPALVASLPAAVDAMGERGEFHTHVLFG